MFKIDLHTHSMASPDGGITAEQFMRVMEDGILDFIAVTDHDTIQMAKALNRTLGNKIIIGQEISTPQGDIIGLFLEETVKPNQSVLATAKAIKEQGGLVYIPHPFETLRSGISEIDLGRIADLVNIVEVHNGRVLLQNRGPKAATWAMLHHKARASASDAHGRKGLGHSYSIIDKEPTAQNLVSLLAHGRLVTHRPPLRTLLYPKYHRLVNKMTHRRIS